eukprot:2242699-Amphidinium_carterae.2
MTIPAMSIRRSTADLVTAFDAIVWSMCQAALSPDAAFADGVYHSRHMEPIDRRLDHFARA